LEAKTLNKSKLKRLLLIFIFLALSSNSLANSVLPLGRMEYEFLYDRIERLQAYGIDRFDYQIGPYTTDSKDFNFEPFLNLIDIPQNELFLFGFVGESFRAQRSVASESFESIRGGLAAQPFEKLYVYGNFVLDEKRADDPTYTGKKWRGLAGDVEQAFANYRTNSFDLTFGRFASFWGVRNSLVLSSNVAMDGVGYSIRWGKLSLSYRLARLDGLIPESDSVAQFENRFFAGHRLDIHFSRNLRIGFFESVVFGGPGRQVEFYYLNPVLFFHGSQLNEGANDNTFVGLDFDFIPREGVRLYGQLLIDDYQIDNKSQGDQEPNEIGLTFGAHLVKLIPQFDLKTSYTRVTNRTYNQGLERNRYLYDGQLLSAALGNDYDQFSVSLLHWLDNENVAAGINFSYTRRGEGSVTDPWTTPWLAVSGDYTEPFPTGVVEKTNRISMTAKGFISDFLFIDFEAGMDEIANLDHIEGAGQTAPFVRLKVSTFLSTLLDVH
jgi:hypothetical protein